MKIIYFCLILFLLSEYSLIECRSRLLQIYAEQQDKLIFLKGSSGGRSSGGSHSGGSSSSGSHTTTTGGSTSSGSHTTTTGGTSGTHTEGGSSGTTTHTTTGGTSGTTHTEGAGGTNSGTTTPINNAGGSSSSTTHIGTGGTGYLPGTTTTSGGSHIYSGGTGTGSNSRSSGPSSLILFIIGIILFIISFPVLWYNEKRGVKIAQLIDEGLEECVEINDGKLDSNNDGKLICVHGQIKPESNLIDEEIGISIENGIVLKRIVEIYQYVERKDGENYIYEKKWCSHEVNSDSFDYIAERGKNENKTKRLFSDHEFYLDPTKLGDYKLNKELKNQLIPDKTDFIFNNQNLKKDEIESKTGKHIFIGENCIFIQRQNDPEKLRLGDHKITYKYLLGPKNYTVVGLQKGEYFEYYYGKANQKNMEYQSIEMINKNEDNKLNENLIENHQKNISEKGICSSIKDIFEKSIRILWIFEDNVPLKVCFDKKLSEESRNTWILRLVGFIMMTFGVYFFFAPLMAIFNWIPILGTLISILFFIFSLSVGISFSLITISIAWFFYRPIIGFFMVCGSILLYILTVTVI